ncbi:Enoyl-CoA hydratase/isomerase [Thermosinus carboxydivorans Nor1]|uniref:Enoyl-CoA hydratase/isomerase n=1 Tax=Thermosinus carboxydivorans Nor1 TaxID=401526 RepID=A1HSH2_9FIRM|nr:enoyl-CoA hydratase-related protein [Thermosinus carboxydivorans]EAX47035.1 Enoyl-CoA hydratase/isomerase [Thermosinus carboxydivorans Nor1]
MPDNIVVERDGAIAVIIVNRPKEMNALNLATMLELDRIIRSLEDDQSVGALIITGSGEKAFVAGADISEMADMGAMQAKEWARLGQQVFSRIENFPRPVIAAVNGYALGGGCELAMACDIRLASEKAKFGQPEVNLGIIPGFGGTQRLTRLVGKGQAKLLIFSGDIIDAQEALRIGLVDRVVSADELMVAAKALANKMIAKAPLAVSQAKLAINKGVEMDSESGYMFESEIFGMCFTTADQKEGMRAFLEKRKPVFSGQ